MGNTGIDNDVRSTRGQAVLVRHVKGPEPTNDNSFDRAASAWKGIAEITTAGLRDLAVV